MWWEVGTYIVTAASVGASITVILDYILRHRSGHKRLADELNLMRAIDQLIKMHGNQASQVAAMRALELYDQGDISGFRVWRQIAKSVDERLSETKAID